METYLVGGAVRDELLGLPVTERDWVVVGATEQEMKRLGYRSVGKDFPVFLHPTSQEEYALARTERKSGPGHTGFICHATPEVTLEEDLLRRDLTINAIARNESGDLTDPYGGVKDLQNRILRHVSSAFTEDPLRILRVARFLARFSFMGFSVAEETLSLMRSMTQVGAMKELTPERVFLELRKALSTRSPAMFFTLLSDIGASKDLWPELQNYTYLQSVTTDDPRIRYASLFTELNTNEIRTVCKRLKAPNSYTELAVMADGLKADWQRIITMPEADIVGLLHQADAYRRPERFAEVNHYLKLIHSVRSGTNSAAQLQHLWQSALNICSQPGMTDIAAGLKGPAIREALDQQRMLLLERDLQR